MTPEKAKTLAKLRALLKRKPCTALDIVAELGCSKPTAYSWVRVLRARGEAVTETRSPSGATGPQPATYRIKS